MKLLGAYTNGNYNVHIYDDGTKIRCNNGDSFEPMFPESIDMKISNKCDRMCPYCHEQSMPDGKLANLNHPLLDSIKPYTELALGGGNVLEHPDLVPFLTRMRDHHVICNITLHQWHFLHSFNFIKELVDANLIHGIGVSVSSNVTEGEMQLYQKIPNLVIHVIAGIVSMDILNKLTNHGLKLLILGYKDFGRGESYLKHHSEINSKIQELEDNLDELRKHFKIISFDNLAIEQLHIRAHISPERWNKYYMGNDGQFTMYVDLVNNEYAKSSTSKRYFIYSKNIDKLFADIPE